jgi:hypothetical protein
LKPCVLILLAAGAARAACPTGSVYPATLDSDATLTIARNNVVTRLSQPMLNTDTVAVVSSISNWSANMMATVDTGAAVEMMWVTAVSGTPPGTGTLTVNRGCEGTTPVSHATGAAFVNNATAYSGHTSLTSATVAIETALGTNLSNLPPGVKSATGKILVYDGPTAIAPDGTTICSPSSGSTTYCLQETLTYAKTNHSNVMCQPGGGSVWNVSTTITIPAYQNWVIDCQGPTLNYTSSTGDFIVVDSQINSRIALGTVVSGSSGVCVHLLPQNMPGDPVISISDTEIFINAISSNGTIGTTGLSIDGANGTITWNTIRVLSIGSFPNNVVVPNTAHTTNYNNIYLEHIQTPVSGTTTGINVGASASLNKWWGIGIDGTSNTSAKGIITAGSNDFWYGLTLINLPTTGNGITLSASAMANEFRINFWSGALTNSATTTTNRFFIAGMDAGSFCDLKLGFCVTTPSVPLTATNVKNGNVWPVIVTFLTAGGGGTYLVEDAEGNAGTGAAWAAGTQVYLNPGEIIQLGYSGAAPTWQWRAVQ